VRHKQKACTICILLLCSRHKSILSFASYTERGRAGQHAVQLYARRCVLCGTQKKRVQSAFCCFVEGISRSFPLPRTQNVGEQGSMLYSYVHTYTHLHTHTHKHTHTHTHTHALIHRTWESRAACCTATCTHTHTHLHTHTLIHRTWESRAACCTATCTNTYTLTHTHAHTQNVGEQGSMLYSYVHGDAFCERQESAKVVTTSSGERDVPLFKKIMGDNKKKQQVCVCVCCERQESAKVVTTSSRERDVPLF